MMIASRAALDQLFRGDCSSLALTVATHAVKEFQVELDELHNDSTTVTFSGDYADAAQESRRRGQPRLAITWGHNKDHRPDLKQLLFILTVSKDGGIPVYFQAKSGNVADDTTHRDTWDLTLQAGRPGGFPLRGRLQVSQHREHGLRARPWRPVPDRAAPHPV